MSLEKRQRFAFFVLALLLHAFVFYLVFHLTIFAAPIQSQDETDFTEIKIPARPPIPPEAPPPPPPTMPNVMPPAATPATVVPVVTTTSSTLALPKVDVIPTSLPEFPAIDEQPAIAPNSNSGEGGAGGGGGNEANSPSNGQDLLGGNISATARIAVVIDVSNSMTAFDAVARDCIDSLYRSATFYPAPNAIGGEIYLDSTAPSNTGAWLDALGHDNFCLSRQDPSATDLYDTVYLALKNNPQIVVIVTDFEDGYLPEATTLLVATLRKSHVELILLSREMAAYPGLPEYSRESGGSYRFVQLDEKATTVANIQPDPKLPDSPPISEVYALMQLQHLLPHWNPRGRISSDAQADPVGDGLITHALNILADGYSPLRRITYHQQEQDARDEVTRQLLLYCTNHPHPGDGQLMALMGRIGGEMHPVAANTGADASAAHVAQLIIPVVLQSQDQALLRFLPELIRNTANCRNSIPAQAYSNAEGVVLACDEHIDGLTECPRRLASGILQAVTLCQGSSNPQVQAACCYLRFALGDRTGLDACIAKVSKAKNDLLEVRLLKRIEISDGVAGDKMDFVAQHRENLIFDGATGRWHFQSLPPAEPTAFSSGNQTNAAQQ